MPPPAGPPRRGPRRGVDPAGRRRGRGPPPGGRAPPRPSEGGPSAPSPTGRPGGGSSTGSVVRLPASSGLARRAVAARGSTPCLGGSEAAIAEEDAGWMCERGRHAEETRPSRGVADAPSAVAAGRYVHGQARDEREVGVRIGVHTAPMMPRPARSDRVPDRARPGHPDPADPPAVPAHARRLADPPHRRRGGHRPARSPGDEGPPPTPPSPEARCHDTRRGGAPRRPGRSTRSRDGDTSRLSASRSSSGGVVRPGSA